VSLILQGSLTSRMWVERTPLAWAAIDPARFTFRDKPRHHTEV